MFATLVNYYLLPPAPPEWLEARAYYSKRNIILVVDGKVRSKVTYH